jgi:hypothetical protein
LRLWRVACTSFVRTIGSTGCIKIRRFQLPSKSPKSSTRFGSETSKTGSLRTESHLPNRRLRAICELS